MLCAAGCTVQTTAVVTVCDMARCMLTVAYESCVVWHLTTAAHCSAMIRAESPINGAHVCDKSTSHRTIARTAPLPPAKPALQSRSSCRPSFRWPRSHAACVSAQRLPTTLPAYATRRSGRGWRCSNSATRCSTRGGRQTKLHAERASVVARAEGRGGAAAHRM